MESEGRRVEFLQGDLTDRLFITEVVAESKFPYNL